MGELLIKRIYEPAETTDGFRILIDRLWPRGMKKENAHMDVWMKNISPSTDLRKWFNHDPTKWEEFNARYSLELKQNPAVDELLKYMEQHETVTLLYAAHDEQHNHALVLQGFMKELGK